MSFTGPGGLEPQFAVGPPPGPAIPDQLELIGDYLDRLGHADPAERLNVISDLARRQLGALGDLTYGEAERVLTLLHRRQRARGLGSGP